MEKILISGPAWLREGGGGGVEGVLHDPRELSGRVGGPFPSPLRRYEKTEQEGVFCSDSVFIGMLRHITQSHVTARPVTYGVLLSGILTSHLITSVMNSNMWVLRQLNVKLDST